MRFALFVAAALSAVSAVGCKGDPFRPDAGEQILVDADKPAWFSPAPGEVKNWDIQLQAPYSLTTPRAMMIVNLWDVVPMAMTITYDEPMLDPVSVPAGSQANAITGLKSLGAKVICHVGMGAVRLTEPDVMRLPGYSATLPNRPTAIAADSAIGWSTSEGDAMERFVDHRNATARHILTKRVKLAKDIGCDGILSYRNDVAGFIEPGLQHGFPSQITAEHDKQWLEAIATEGHTLTLSVGARGLQMANIGAVQRTLDWFLLERCGEDNCDLAQPFTAQLRAVFGLDYTVGEDGTTPNTLPVVCPKWVDGKVDGIMKVDLDGGDVPMFCS